jgi:hypothetical protein
VGRRRSKEISERNANTAFSQEKSKAGWVRGPILSSRMPRIVLGIWEPVDVIMCG